MFILLEAVGGVGRPVNHGEPASESPPARAVVRAPLWMGDYADFL